MNPEEKTKLERLLADAAAQDPPPERLRQRVLSAEAGVPESVPHERRRARFRFELWPPLAAGILFAVIVWRVTDVAPPPARTPAQVQESRLRDLVRRLGAEEVEARHAAATDLLAFGETARGTLEEAAKTGEPEVRLRAQELLATLDLRARIATLSRRAFPLGEAGVLCIEAPVFDLVGDEENLPDGLKPVLLSAGGHMIGMVILEEGRVRSSEIKTLGMTATSVAGPLLFCRQRFGLATNRATPGRAWGVPAHPLGTWSKEAKPLRGADLFRHWPQLRRSSLVFLVPLKPNERSEEALRKGLEEAVSHERPEVRAGAVHLFRHYVQKSAVETVLRKLDDGAPVVRETAKETLRILVNAPEGAAAEETRAWWKALDAKRQSELLLELAKAEPAARACTCESSQSGK